MRVVVVYESMYGNTHQVAVAIAEGLAAAGEVAVSDVGGARALLETRLDLLVVGGPTHIHGMTSVRSRQAAMAQAEQKHLIPDGSAPGPGLREWLATADLPVGPILYATFDTRVDAAALLTGRAAPRIAKLMRRPGWTQLTAPTSFLVTSTSRLLPGEIDRARRWGMQLADMVSAQHPGDVSTRQIPAT